MDREAKIAEARRLRAEGLTYPKIAEALGVSTSTTHAWLNPDLIAKRRKYKNCPEYKERQRQYHKRPEVQARVKEYLQTPETKARIKEYVNRPEVKARKRKADKEYRDRPENKIKANDYNKRLSESGYFREWERRKTAELRPRCVRALQASKVQARKRGHAPCNATVEELMEAFDGHCVICGRHEAELSRRVNMDHCHFTGDFRGWLCQPCNAGVGLLRDDPGGILNYLSPSHAQIFLQAFIQGGR